MSIYSDGLTALQRVGLHGGDLTHTEKRNLLACIRAGAATGSAALATADTAVQLAQVSLAASDALSVTQAAAIVTQWALIDAAVADVGVDKAALADVIATAKTALYTPGATVGTAVHASKVLLDTAGTLSTAAVAAVPAAVTLVSNPIIDGYDT